MDLNFQTVSPFLDFFYDFRQMGRERKRTDLPFGLCAFERIATLEIRNLMINNTIYDYLSREISRPSISIPSAVVFLCRLMGSIVSSSAVRETFPPFSFSFAVI